MAFNRLALEFPRLAAELERLSSDDLQAAVGADRRDGLDHQLVYKSPTGARPL